MFEMAVVSKIVKCIFFLFFAKTKLLVIIIEHFLKLYARLIAIERFENKRENLIFYGGFYVTWFCMVKNRTS